MNHFTELMWLAAALAFVGSFGIGWTAEGVMRRVQERKTDDNKDLQ